MICQQANQNGVAFWFALMWHFSEKILKHFQINAFLVEFAQLLTFNILRTFCKGLDGRIGNLVTVFYCKSSVLAVANKNWLTDSIRN